MNRPIQDQNVQLSPEERDKRTIFVKQLAQRLREYELNDFFSRAGAIREVKIVMDKYSRRSKGFVFNFLKELLIKFK